MATPQQILSRLTTADGQTYDTLSYVYFNVALVDLVNASGTGGAEAINGHYGRLPVPSGLQSATYARDGNEYVNIVLSTADTYSTPNGFINDKIAELQAQIVELQGLLQ